MGIFEVERFRHERAREVAEVSARSKATSGREAVVLQIQREALATTLAAFPDLAARLSGDDARRRIAAAWTDALLNEAGQ